MWSKRETVVAVVCLVVGSAGQLLQYVVTPVVQGDSAAKNVAEVVAHPVAMQWAAWLDVGILFFLPALVVVARLAGAGTTRLGWVAAVVAVASTVPGIAYILAPDVLYVGASHGDVTATAIASYNGTAVVMFATIVFLVGHVLGLLLLAVALWRAGAVPRWAAACLALYPVCELGGGVGISLVGVAAYLLLMAAFGACALAVVRASTMTASRKAVLVGSC